MNCQSIFRSVATLFLAAVLTSFTTGCDKAGTPEKERVPEPGDVPAPTVTFDGKTIYFDEATETFSTIYPTRTNFWAGAKQTMYYPALLQDEKFRTRLVERWDAQKDTFKQLADYIDETAERIRVSEGYNQSLWPITNDENGDEKMTFQEAVDRMRQAFLDKWEWMDKNIKNLK